jgi:hypothetical protein
MQAVVAQEQQMIRMVEQTVVHRPKCSSRQIPAWARRILVLLV